MIDILAAYTLALALGGIVFFSFVFSPLVFIKLPAEVAGPFIRDVFPWYFLAGIVVFAIAALLLWQHPVLSLLAAALAALGAANRQLIMPWINTLRDRQLGGDAEAAGAFHRLHMASVAINFVQLAGAAVLFGWLVAP